MRGLIDLRSGKPMTRGGFLKGILASGIAPAITLGTLEQSVYANATVGGMMRGVGARQAAMFGGGEPTAKDYVQNGLIAMWDGVENIGFGRHDSSSTVWKDLSGNDNDAEVTNGYFLDDCLFSNVNKKQVALCNTINSNTLIGSCTVEIVIFLSDLNGMSNSEGLIFWNLTRGSRYFAYRRSSDDIVFINQYGYKTGGIDNYLLKTKSVSVAYTSVGRSVLVNGDEQVERSLVTSWNYDINAFCVFGRGYDYLYNVNGKCHCVRIYNRQLTASEVLSNYKIDKKRFNI